MLVEVASEALLAGSWDAHGINQVELRIHALWLKGAEGGPLGLQEDVMEEANERLAVETVVEQNEIIVELRVGRNVALFQFHLVLDVWVVPERSESEKHWD